MCYRTSMNNLAPDILTRFANIIGDKYVLRDDIDMAKYLDEPRKKFHGSAAAVLRPESTREVSQILKLANETGTAIIPQGGNTGLVGGQTPDASGKQVILSLERLAKIRNVDASQNTLTVEAGVTLEAGQEAAASVDRFLPLSLASQGSCTIGGNLATNAGGLNVVAYGSARDLCLGLEVVLADGRIWDGLNTLRKNNTGYDLKSLFIGSEGTLGIITAAVMELFPASQSRATAFLAVASPAEALELLNLAQQQSGERVTTIELLPREGLEFTITHRQTRDPFDQPHPWYVLLELSSSQPGNELANSIESILAMALDKGMAIDAVIAQSDRQTDDIWAIRELLPETQKNEGGSIKHDISVPLDKISDFLAEAAVAVVKLIPGARPVAFGHIGDGNIHFNVTQPIDADTNAFLDRWDEVNTIVHDIATGMGGSVSAEHGIGQLKRHLMP
ncbi:MAG TPA: FAD-binding oxidoreductase, partial [Rhizobiales bacterium]|nr:FAD-binding oxidoreductase [Hyphomicrobiales bacterium]